MRIQLWKLAPSASAMALLLATPALAQTPPEQSTSENTTQSADAPEDEEIVITGTNIRGVAPVGSEAVTLSRQDIENSGHAQVADILRTLPQMQQSSVFADVPVPANPAASNQLTFGASSNETHGSAADIRGLGPSATLVLVDGRRQLATGTFSNFVDINRVPAAALERIEVVSDGASAVYGSDAVAGVINLITRKDYEGVEFTGRYTTNDLFTQQGGSIVGGTRWQFNGRPGNVIVTYDYDHRDRVTYADSARIASDFTQFGGNNAINSGRPAPAGAGYVFSSCPAGYSFVFIGCFRPAPFDFFTLTPQTYDLQPGPGGVPVIPFGSGTAGIAQNIQSGDNFRDYLPETTRNAIDFYLNQELTNNFSIYIAADATRRETVNNASTVGSFGNFVVMQNVSPFYPVFQGPTPGTLDPSAPVQISVPLLYHQTTESKSTDFSFTAGFKADLPYEWQAEGYASAAGSRYNPGDVAGHRAPDLLALGRLADLGLWNPFDGPIPQSIVDAATITGDKGLGDVTHASASDYVLKFSGPLFTLPAGEVRAAAGVEHTRFSNSFSLFFVQDDCSDTSVPCNLSVVRDPTRSGVANRDVDAVFGEVFVPIVGEANAIPLVTRLALNLAVRSERYSDFGSTTNPRVGVTWDLTDAFSLRGSWGKAFRAPDLTELSASSLPIYLAGVTGPNNQTGNPIYGAPGGTNTVEIGGANPDLGPERATNWSIGFDYQPRRFLQGLDISATYYKIEYRDRIVALPASLFLSSAQNALTYQQYLTPVANPNPPGCNDNDPATYAPEVRAAVGSVVPTTQLGGGICGAQLILDERWQNAASVIQDGIDFNVRYVWDAGEVGQFHASVAASKILGIREELIAGQRTTPDPLNRTYFPLDLRANASLGWNRGPWAAQITINYVPGYTNDQGFIPLPPPPAAAGTAGPSVHIPSWTTADVSLSYDVRSDDVNGWLHGVRIGLNVINVTDEDAPIVLTGESLNSSYDSRNANIYGRQLTLQVTKAF